MRLSLALVITCLMLTAACTTLKEVPTPSIYIAAKHPSSIWVTHDDLVTRVDQPRVTRDTLVGVTLGRAISIPLRDVSDVSIRQTDWPSTMALGMMVGGGALVVFSALYPPKGTGGSCIPGGYAECTPVTYGPSGQPNGGP